jgi:hypothetical protein
MRVMIFNTSKNMIMMSKQTLIGEFLVPIKSITKKLYTKP